jgi:glycine cleavage system transcriptional repressor
MRHFAVSAIGRDRPGIVSAVSKVLLEHSGNLEDSQMTILRGRFTIMLIVSTPDNVDQGRLEGELRDTAGRLGLDAVSLSEVTEFEPEAEPPPSHIVSVYGVDHPGIVHGVTTALSDEDVNITDLSTRLAAGQDGEPIYAMILEVALPPGKAVESIERRLAEVRKGQGVELTVRQLEQDTL